MSEIKNWVMDMEESVHNAIDSNCKNVEQVIAYVKDRMEFVDENYIREYLEENINQVSYKFKVTYI